MYSFFPHTPTMQNFSMGGTVALLSKNNIKVGLIDLTKGEMGTRGTAETRQREAFNAAITLKAAMRENLEIPDGNIQLNKENLLKVIITIRKYRPSIVFAPYFNDRHPDHIDASQLIKRAVFYSGLAKIKTFDREVPQQQFRPDKLFYFMQTYTFEPTFIVDISETFEQKMKAIACYETQFHNPKSTELETFISRPEFINYIRSRAEFYGFQIHKRYGEPFFCEEKLELNLLNFFDKTH